VSNVSSQTRLYLHHSIEEAGIAQVVDALDRDKCAIHWTLASLSVHIFSGFLSELDNL